jgi:hypothetical protein
MCRRRREIENMTLTLDRVPDALTDRIKDFASSKVPERADEQATVFGFGY